MHRLDFPFDPPADDGPPDPPRGPQVDDRPGAMNPLNPINTAGSSGNPGKPGNGQSPASSRHGHGPAGKENFRHAREEARREEARRNEARNDAKKDATKHAPDADDPIDPPAGQGPAEPRLRPEEAYAAVLRRARFLPQSDRALLDLALNGRVTRREIAALLKLPPGTVTRRLQRLSRRLHDPLVVALIERPGCLAEEYRVLGIEYFLQKQTLSQLADLHRLSRAQVQQMIHFIRGWFAGSRGK